MTDRTFVGPVFYVMVPFPSEAMAESFLVEHVDEEGFRGSILTHEDVSFETYVRAANARDAQKENR